MLPLLPRKPLAAALALLLPALLLAQPAALELETIEPIDRESNTEIAFLMRTKPADAPQAAYAIERVRRNGQPLPAPANMKLDAKTGAFQWTPSPSQVGKYDVTLRVKDGGDREASTSVAVNVRPRAVSADNSEAGKLLTLWYKEGTAAGNVGDWYDNRDRDHSALNRKLFPQLDEVQYTPEQRKTNQDWASARQVLPFVTFGNSSTSAPPTGGGCNPRMYYTNPRGMVLLYQQYRGNNLYMYPAHHDHHPGHNGKPFYGDLLPANTPYVIVSQGSSGTDQPFMRAVPLTLAAFKPEVKKKLIETGLLMPTVQYIFRASNKHLTDPKEYLTGKAHPAVFEGSWVNDLKMVKTAHDLELATIPPLVQLKVVEEDKPVVGKDYFEPPVNEQLADTPAAIARVVRGPNYVRRMVVSAEESFDVNKQPLKYHWVVLRGDAARIQIKAKNDSGSVVELLVPYHERRPIDGHHLKMDSNRVDIGVFVSNGTHYSAPGFVTFYTLDHEARTYDDGKLLEIGYNAGEADLAVTDWAGLLDLFRPDAKGLGAQLLRDRFTPAQREALVKAAADYRTTAEPLIAAQDKAKQSDAVRQKAQKEFQAAEERRTAAKKAYDDKPTPESLEAVTKAGKERDSAEAARKAADADHQAATKEVEAAKKTADAVLGQKRPDLDAPVTELIAKALAHLQADPMLYFGRRAEIDGLLDAAGKAKVAAGAKRLAGFGVVKLDADGNGKLTPIRTGAGPLAERLTTYEKQLLARFNDEVIAAALLPKLVNPSFRVNLTDFRLSTSKNWRDVYHHDKQGRIIGWTRYDGAAAPVDFNTAGEVILEKDARGRAMKTRTAKYEIDAANARPPAVMPLKRTAGDKIHHYEYQGDDDWIGSVTKTDAVDADKKD